MTGIDWLSLIPLLFFVLGAIPTAWFVSFYLEARGMGKRGIQGLVQIVVLATPLLFGVWLLGPMRELDDLHSILMWAGSLSIAIAGLLGALTRSLSLALASLAASVLGLCLFSFFVRESYVNPLAGWAGQVAVWEAAVLGVLSLELKRALLGPSGDETV